MHFQKVSFKKRGWKTPLTTEKNYDALLFWRLVEKSRDEDMLDVCFRLQMKEMRKGCGSVILSLISPRKISLPEALKISHQSRFKVWFTPNPPSTVMQSQPVLSQSTAQEIFWVCVSERGFCQQCPLIIQAIWAFSKLYPLEVW